MKFLVKEIKNEICGLCKRPANRGVVTFLDAYRNMVLKSNARHVGFMLAIILWMPS